MSEQRRTTLTPFGKSDKKSNKQPRKTFRLRFTLSDPNENSCPVFDYAATVKSEERKLLKKHREDKDKKPNGFVDPFEEDDEDVKRLARKFEAKYGDKKKFKSYAELGAGYDETDPFIDNTDANDEALQEDQETPCGGYYINSGPLELKRVELSDQSDADEVKRRGRKRSLPVIDEEEDDEEEEKEGDGGEEEDEEGGEDEAGEDVERQPVIGEGPSEPKKTKLMEERMEPEKPPTPSYNGMDDRQLVKKKKKKRVIEDDNGDGLLAKTKKAKTVKALLEEKRVQEQPPRISEEPKRQIASETSIVEAIESVVNAGHNQDENSNSSNSVHSAVTASSSVSDDSQDGKQGCGNSPPPLPDSLTPEVTALVEQIKRTAAVTDNTRNTFCTEINNNLIKLEWKTKELPPTGRNMLFAHLAHHLPCTKSTLMRRAKKLFIFKEEGQMETVICKLKATIDATMPTLLEKYGKDCQRIAEEKGLPAGDGNSPGEENQRATSPTVAKLLKRKFPWTDETRGYLLSIARSKQRCFKISKPRKSSWEEYIKAFLHSRIRPLWPKGWMKTSVLMKEITRSPNSGKSKHSSHHSPSKPDSSRLSVSVSFTSSASSNGSLYVSPSSETPLQTTKSSVPGATPLSVKTGAEPINLLTKITSSYNTPPSQSKKPNSSSHHPVKIEKPETFSMDCLLKRTSDGANSHDYNTTLSDIIKKEGVIINGASLPLKNVNSSQRNDSSRSEKILDLSSCNSSVSVSATPSVIQSAVSVSSERTAARGGDSGGARVSSAEKLHNYTTSPGGKEAMSNVPLNRKQRLLQVNSQTNRHSETPDVSVIKKTDSVMKSQSQAVEKMNVQSKSGGGCAGDKPSREREREGDKETTTATDILSQIINESLRSPPQPPYNPTPAKTKEEVKSQGAHKDQELLFDVMQDLKELNHLSGGSSRDSKSTSFTGASWSHPVKSLESSKSTPYHNEFLNYIAGNAPKETSLAASTPTPLPYSRHSTSSYDNSAYVNEVNKSMYSYSPLRTSQSLTTHTSTPSNKVTQMNQMKNLPNAGISSGLPHRYMGQMDYSSEDPHLMGLASSLQYSLTNWPYTGSESQSHQ